jgi:Zinc-finger associated domain (zf-AD)
MPICRLCVESKSAAELVIAMTDVCSMLTFQAFVEFYCRIDLSSDLTLPQRVCVKCRDTLQAFVEFSCDVERNQSALAEAIRFTSQNNRPSSEEIDIYKIRQLLLAEGQSSGTPTKLAPSIKNETSVVENSQPLSPEISSSEAQNSRALSEEVSSSNVVITQDLLAQVSSSSAEVSTSPLPQVSSSNTEAIKDPSTQINSSSDGVSQTQLPEVKKEKDPLGLNGTEVKKEEDENDPENLLEEMVEQRANEIPKKKRGRPRKNTVELQSPIRKMLRVSMNEDSPVASTAKLKRRKSVFLDSILTNLSASENVSNFFLNLAKTEINVSFSSLLDDSAYHGRN